MLVVRGRLPPEQGAVLLKALEMAGYELAEHERGSAEPPAGDTVTGPARDSAEPLAQSAGPVTRDDSAGPRGATPSPGRWLADGLARVAERALEAAAAEAGPGGADRFLVVVHVDAEVLASPEADGRCELENGPALAADAVRRIACDASLVALLHGEPVDYGWAVDELCLREGAAWT